ncbi:MAG: 50S ribosomal protein L10 [Planctomycetota bacterium]|jgi:large subunit ribosomal protein L10|nr:50S ribosomal protein L10 [Planctomycetota bacterium]MDP6990087.1 50S ribosomal protein L10 [Planctomycetota bacterium]
MANLVNTLICKELDSELTDVEGLVLVSFAGLTVAETEDVRGELANHGVKFRMLRNNLARRVMSERGLEFPDETFVGNTALAYGDAEQAILAAKVFADPEVKKAGKIKFKAGLLEGAVLDAADSQALADIPDRQTLQAKLLGCLSGPARGIVCALSGVPGGLARVVQARVDAGGPLEEEAGAAETDAAAAEAEPAAPEETPAEAEASEANDDVPEAPTEATTDDEQNEAEA